jgi:NADH-quinone oxidoreductase E subunit
VYKRQDENLQRVQEVVKKYPHPQAAVMPALYIAQEQNGYITNEAMKEVAGVLGMDAEDVLGVASFYTMFHKKPVGKYHVQVCTNVSCMLKGGYELWKTVLDKLDIKEGEVTTDMKFSVEEVECMGACGGAPMIAVNDDYYENLSKEKVLELIESLK